MPRKKSSSPDSNNASVGKLERKIKALEAELDALKVEEAEARRERLRAEERERYELDSLRWFIVSHVPHHALSDLVGRYIHGKATVDDVVSAVLAAAVELPPHEYAGAVGIRSRALCPLCGDGPEKRYHQFPDQGYGGFSVPVDGDYGYTPLGLERHLVGYANFHHCVVMKEAKALFQGERQKRQEQEIRRRAAEDRAVAERARRLADPNEPLIGVGPDNKRALYDGKPLSFDEAEKSVVGAGFERRIDGRVRSYVLTFRDLLIYADLCDEFRAFRGALLVGTVRQATYGPGWRKKLELKLAKHSPLRVPRRSRVD